MRKQNKKQLIQKWQNSFDFFRIWTPFSDHFNWSRFRQRNINFGSFIFWNQNCLKFLGHLISLLITFFGNRKNVPSSAFFSSFLVFLKQTITILQQINVKKCPSNNLCLDSNSRPSDFESPLITTRPGLPANS